MPHIEARRNTKGDITSYKIVVSAGYVLHYTETINMER